MASPDVYFRAHKTQRFGHARFCIWDVQKRAQHRRSSSDERFCIARGRDLQLPDMQDPDGYRIELIDRDFPTPQDPDD